MVEKHMGRGTGMISPRRVLARLRRDERGNLLIESLGMVAVMVVATLVLAGIFAGMNRSATASFISTRASSQLSSTLQDVVADRSTWPASGKPLTRALPSGGSAQVWRSVAPAAKNAAALDQQKIDAATLPPGVTAFYLNAVTASDGKSTCSATSYAARGCQVISHQVVDTLGGVTYRTLHSGDAAYSGNAASLYTWKTITVPKGTDDLSYFIDLNIGASTFEGCSVMTSLGKKSGSTVTEVDSSSTSLERSLTGAGTTPAGHRFLAGTIDVSDYASSEERVLTVVVGGCTSSKLADPRPGTGSLLLYTSVEQKG